jgi:hypothetical protein
MNVTVLIQAGTDGPVKVREMPLASVERSLKTWQEGSPAPLHLRAIHAGGIILDGQEHVVFADWYAPIVLAQIAERHGDGLEIREGLAAAHEATLSRQQAARDLAALRSLT